jgi:hypothetical protein
LRRLTFRYLCFSCEEPSPRGFTNLYFHPATVPTYSACCASMNYTGNPRRLRRGARSSHRGLGARNRQPTPTTRPWLDICGSFQRQRDGGATGGDADNSIAPDTTSSSEDVKDEFQSKRRRLLEQGDWLGLEIGASIDVPSSPALEAGC